MVRSIMPVWRLAGLLCMVSIFIAGFFLMIFGIKNRVIVTLVIGFAAIFGYIISYYYLKQILKLEDDEKEFDIN